MKEKGIALILVLWLFVILTTLGLLFASSIKLWLKIAKNQEERLIAYYIAKGGCEQAILKLKRDKDRCDHLNEEWSKDEDAYREVSLGGGMYDVEVVDEERKLNINLPHIDPIIMRMGDIDPGLTNRIIAFRKERGLLRSIYELFSIDGIDDEAFEKVKELFTVYTFREDRARIDLNTSGENDLRARLGLTFKEMKELIRMRPFTRMGELFRLEWMSKERFAKIIDHIRLPGMAYVNINTASEEVLRGLGFDAYTVQKIIDQREKKPFMRVSEVVRLTRVEAMEEVSWELLDTRSYVFSIHSVGTYNGTMVHLNMIVKREDGNLRILSLKEII
jgi:type II secretory pathway component PulK